MGKKSKHALCSTACHKMLHVLDGKMLQKQMKVGEQLILKQPNMRQNCANFQFLHMRFLHNICAIANNSRHEIGLFGSSGQTLLTLQHVIPIF
jgi:hypothetical protein